MCNYLVSPYWSLSYEWWFYIIFGCVSMGLTSKSSTIKIVGFVLAGCSGLVFMMGSMAIYYLMIWFLGALAYIVRPKQSNRYVFWLSVIGIIISVGLYQLSKDTRSINIPIHIAKPEIIEVILTIFMCLFIQQVVLYEPHNKVGKKMESVLGYMGNFSYSLYLSHRIVMMWIFYYVLNKHDSDMSWNGFLCWIFVVIVCLMICWLLSLISEKHTPYIKKKLKLLLIK